jgi:hypothetical protein
MPAADWTIGLNASVVPVTMSPAPTLVWDRAAATVSVTWAAAASVSAAPFGAAFVAVGMRGSLLIDKVAVFPEPVSRSARHLAIC